MRNNFPLVYAVKHKDIDIRMKSRSGGIFTAISDYILKNGGVVYGCVMNEKLEAIHIRATSIEQRNLMRGSKYIESKMGDCFKLVKKDLEAGTLVLFSGTSCQIVGLSGFLQKEYENLILFDIICHGVPSPKVFRKYVNWQEQVHGLKCIGIDFRNKIKFGWKEHIETLTMIKNSKKRFIDSNVFTKIFYDHNVLRPACYNCPYKSILHPSDITIGDYWGIEKAAENFNDNKGLSIVLINSDKGDNYLKKCFDSIEYRQCKIEDSMQPPLQKPSERPNNRDEFWSDFSSKKFGYIAKKYGQDSIKNRCMVFLKGKFYFLCRK